MAWSLARKGISTVVLDRARFPREKVCGDYVDPRGLKILAAMGCVEELIGKCSPPITRTATYVQWKRRYEGAIPFYGLNGELPAYGLTVKRGLLDATLLQAAARAGAVVHEQTTVRDVTPQSGGIEVTATRGSHSHRYSARLVVGADGANSVVARRVGLACEDPRRTVLAQRAYAQTAPQDDDRAVAEVFFDEGLFPGYGWVFPSGGGRFNVGVGMLAETRERCGQNVPELLRRFLDGLRRHHPRYGSIELCSKVIGGVVKTYGAATANRFDGGILVGDAGCFVDPMTGEGITPGMESSLLAVDPVTRALESGDCSAGALEGYEQAFRAYFDQSMMFLDLCAGMLRNRHLAGPWLKSLARGCEVAERDGDFARTSGSFFCGLEIRPYDIIGQVWARSFEDGVLAWPRLLGGETEGGAWTTPSDLFSWQVAFARSLMDDPAWHARWMLDTHGQWSRLLGAAEPGREDPRAKGVFPA